MLVSETSEVEPMIMIMMPMFLVELTSDLPTSLVTVISLLQRRQRHAGHERQYCEDRCEHSKGSNRAHWHQNTTGRTFRECWEELLPLPPAPSDRTRSLQLSSYTADPEAANEDCRVWLGFCLQKSTAKRFIMHCMTWKSGHITSL